MSILNRRNAILGWTAWQVGKRAAKRRVKEAVPRRGEAPKRSRKGAIAPALAALGGALWFWRRRRGDEGE
jgi:hypothetical protein